MKNQIADIKVSYTCPVPKSKRVSITNSIEAYNVFIGLWDKNIIEFQEQFWLLVLNRANEVVGSHCISKGGTSSTIVDSKIIFSIALKCNANSIMVAHNHPSGNLKPSRSDIELTKGLNNASKFLEISLLDHLIITKDGYYSFADSGNVI